MIENVLRDLKGLYHIQNFFDYCINSFVCVGNSHFSGIFRLPFSTPERNAEDTPSFNAISSKSSPASILKFRKNFPNEVIAPADIFFT